MDPVALDQEVKTVTAYQALAFVSRLLRADGVSELVGIHPHLEAALGLDRFPTMSDLQVISTTLEGCESGRLKVDDPARALSVLLGGGGSVERILASSLKRMDNLAAYLIKVGTVLQTVVAVLRPLEQMKSPWAVNNS